MRPPRTLKAPVGVWFSCLTQTSAPARAASSGQAICGVGGKTACTKRAAPSSSERLNTAVRPPSRNNPGPGALRGRRLAEADAMAIEVRSDQWTGTSSGEGAASSSSNAPQVCGEFHSRDRLDEAMSKLEGSLFQRADLSLRRVGQEDSAPDSGKETPARQDDVQNVRQLAVGLGGFVGAEIG